jgi:hypothetical protein
MACSVAQSVQTLEAEPMRKRDKKAQRKVDKEKNDENTEEGRPLKLNLSRFLA